MNESQWLSKDSPEAMLEWILDNTIDTDRKLRLFCDACSKMYGIETRKNEYTTSIDISGIVSEAEIWCWEAKKGPLSFSAKKYNQNVSNILRDIFGNPFISHFLPMGIREWNDGTIIKLAEAVYEKRLPNGSFDTSLLMVLSDALLETGLNEGDIINHCRSKETHWRGCWVIDLLLGKT